MKKVTYLAVLEPCTTGFGVYFPDLPGCVASGPDIEQASKQAQEALSMHYHTMLEDHDEIPESSASLSQEDTNGNIIVPITIYPELYAEEYRNRRIKTNTTIPAWLKADAEKLGVNFSRVLEEALLKIVREV